MAQASPKSISTSASPTPAFSPIRPLAILAYSSGSSPRKIQRPAMRLVVALFFPVMRQPANN